MSADWWWLAGARLHPSLPETALRLLLGSCSVVLALFDAIGTDDKRMHVHVGRHQAVPPEAFEASEAFLATRLNGPVG